MDNNNSNEQLTFQDNWVDNLKLRYEFDTASTSLVKLREHLEEILQALNKTEDRWIRQMVPLMIGLLYRGTGRDGFEKLLPLLNDRISIARHYAALALGVVAREPDDIKLILQQQQH